DLGRLFGDNPRLPLRRDQNAGGEPDGLRNRGQKAKRDKSLMERIFLIIERGPAIPSLCSKHVIGDFNRCVPQFFRRLRPIADLRGVLPNIKRGKEGVEFHAQTLFSSSMVLLPASDKLIPKSRTVR